MQPTMYGLQSRIGYSSGSGPAKGFIPQTRGYGKQNRFGAQTRVGYGSSPSELQDSYSYTGKQGQGRFSEYSDYGSYDDGYGGDKTAKSGYGGYGYGAQSHGSFAGGYGKECPGISIALLLISLLGIVLMGWILYTKIVAAGRRKRDLADLSDFSWLVDNFVPLLINGLDEFEEKIESFSSNGENRDWVFQLNNLHYDDAGAVGHHADGDWDGLGSPVQETSWGVDWRRDTSNYLANVTVGEAHKLHNKTADLIQDMSTDDLESEVGDDKAVSPCIESTWQCVSTAIEGSLHYLNTPDGITGCVSTFPNNLSTFPFQIHQENFIQDGFSWRFRQCMEWADENFRDPPSYTVSDRLQ